MTMKFSKNVGSKDKTIRMGLVATSLVMATATRNPVWLLGMLPLFSVLTSWCPLYSLFGKTTCPLEMADSLQSDDQATIKSF